MRLMWNRCLRTKPVLYSRLVEFGETDRAIRRCVLLAIIMLRVAVTWDQVVPCLRRS